MACDPGCISVSISHDYVVHQVRSIPGRIARPLAIGRSRRVRSDPRLLWYRGGPYRQNRRCHNSSQNTQYPNGREFYSITTRWRQRIVDGVNIREVTMMSIRYRTRDDLDERALLSRYQLSVCLISGTAQFACRSYEPISF